MRHDAASNDDLFNIEQKFSSVAEEWQYLITQAQLAWQADDIDRAGDLFGQLRRASEKWLRAIASQKLPDDEVTISVEDFIAETFLALWEITEAGKPIIHVKGLLRTILLRRIADFYRARNKVTEAHYNEDFWDQQAQLVANDEPTPEEVVTDQETARTISSWILDALPWKQREILIARHCDQLTVAQTAAHLGLTEDQVKKGTQRAIKNAQRIAMERGVLYDVN